ncbi:polymeric immunoglobulin receptor-like isoform X2 [Heterodontus francisci]|uniref:polymeric immunoglobulin receptor-like isoform X2 n=1 Tax=Heterodontus francisci TaxID=7792 RepID=UPI00355B748E
MIQYKSFDQHRDRLLEIVDTFAGTMKFIALLFLTLISTLRTQTASTVVKAAVGETVTVECPQAGIQNSVIWCKANSKTWCNIIMSTNKYMDRNYDRRTSITNANGLISVTITQLQETDTGTYFCGPKHETSISISDVILLKVFTDSWEPILSEVNGIMGNATTVPCLYSKQYKYYKKFLCKVTSEDKCTIIASSNGVIGSLYNGRVSITTNNDHNFAVTMSSVSKGDKGEYWCGREKILDIEITQVKVLTIAEVTIGRPTDPSNITSLTGKLKIRSFIPL